MSKLPDRPSELIHLALRDMEAAEKSPLYTVDHNVWHQPDYRNHAFTCAVCSAGSIMAMTLGSDPYANLAPSDFDNDTHRKLLAVNSFRQGFVDLAFRQMGLGDCPMPHAVVASYGGDSPGAFKRDQRWLTNRLAEIGF